MRSSLSLLATVALIGCATPPHQPVRSQPPAPDKELRSVKISESGDAHGTSVMVTPMQSVEEGVYFFRNGFSTLILELRDGRYRYWFSSDVISGDEPKYPLTGRYTTIGPTIRLESEQRYIQDQWTFRKLNGETTLWRPNALEYWSAKRAFDYYGVLYPTKLKPEDVWQKNVWKVGP